MFGAESAWRKDAKTSFRARAGTPYYCRECDIWGSLPCPHHQPERQPEPTPAELEAIEHGWFVPDDDTNTNNQRRHTMASKRKSKQKTVGTPGPGETEKTLSKEEIARFAEELASEELAKNDLEKKKADAVAGWNADLRQKSDRIAFLADAVANGRIFVDKETQSKIPGS